MAVALAALYGKYYETVKSGRVWSGMTAIAGVAPGTAISTTAAFALYNPLGTKRNLVVLRAAIGYLSGTLGAGPMVYATNDDPSAAAVTGTAITATNALLGSQAGASGRPLTTATLPTTPTLLRPFAAFGASLASTVNVPWHIVEDVDGEFLVGPGTSLSLHADAAAGSTPLVVIGMTWAEVDI